MPTSTTNYSLQKPLVNNPTDEDLWGDEINDDMDDIDTLLRQGICTTSESSQTTGFTATATISVKKLYPCDSTGGAFNATIPLASASGNGATVFIKKTDSSTNAVTILRTGSDTLDGETSLSLSAQNECYGLVSDGVSAWKSISKPYTTIVPDASTSVKGIIQIATAAEVTTGTDSLKAVVPSTVSANKGVSKAWVSFVGTTGVIIDSYNVSSVTRNSSGNYTVNFTTAFADNKYAVCGTSGGDATGTPSSLNYCSPLPYTLSTTSASVAFPNQGNGTFYDNPHVSLVFYGAQ